MDVLVNDLYIAVRSDRCDSQQERLVVSSSIIKKSPGFGCDEICRILTFVGDWVVMIALESSVIVFVGVRIQQEV